MLKTRQYTGGNKAVLLWRGTDYVITSSPISRLKDTKAQWTKIVSGEAWRIMPEMSYFGHLEMLQNNYNHLFLLLVVSLVWVFSHWHVAQLYSQPQLCKTYSVALISLHSQETIILLPFSYCCISQIWLWKSTSVDQGYQNSWQSFKTCFEVPWWDCSQMAFLFRHAGASELSHPLLWLVSHSEDSVLV